MSYGYDEAKGLWTLTAEMLEVIKKDSYKEGVTDALCELSDVFEGVEDTDLWSEYMEEEEN